MSGFDFSIVCRTCGLQSRDYPFVYDSIAAPTEIVLPVANSASQQFERFVVATDRQLEARELDELAASSSRPGFVVCVPRYNDRYEQALEPVPACPRCGSSTIEVRPPAPPSLHPHGSIEQLVSESRTMTDDVTSSHRLDPPGVTIRVQHQSGPPRVFRWTVVKEGTIDIALVVDELIAALGGRGSTCGDVRRFRGFTQFVEHAAV